MATLPINVSTPEALLEPENVDQAATSGGDDFPNDGHILLFIKNAHTAPVTLTVDSIPNKTYAVTNAKSYLLGPFPQQDFGDKTGKVRISFDVITNITIAAIRAL